MSAYASVDPFVQNFETAYLLDFLSNTPNLLFFAETLGSFFENFDLDDQSDTTI